MKCPICNCRTHVEPVHTFAGAESERKCPLCGRRYQLDPGPDGRALPIVPRPAPEPKEYVPPAKSVNSARHTPNQYKRADPGSLAWDEYPRWQALPIAEQQERLARVKAQMKESGHSLRGAAEAADLSPSRVSEMFRGRAYAGPVREAIAELLGRPYLEVWGEAPQIPAPPVAHPCRREPQRAAESRREPQRAAESRREPQRAA